MSKRRKDPGRVRQQHPQQSFQQMVASQTLEKFQPYIDNQIRGLAGALAQQQTQTFENVYTRLVVIEELLEEHIEGVNKDVLANRVADVQDRAEGLEKVENGPVESGDRVRLEIATRSKDQEEFQGESRLQLDGVGSGNTLGKELEEQMIGMRAGETRELEFGKDKGMIAKVNINRISRPVKKEQENDSDEG